MQYYLKSSIANSLKIKLYLRKANVKMIVPYTYLRIKSLIIKKEFLRFFSYPCHCRIIIFVKHSVVSFRAEVFKRHSQRLPSRIT